MDRVVKYVDYVRLSAFWIDQECVDQQDSCAKGSAMQSMDLVYRCSKYPLGILTVQLQQHRQVRLLYQLLRQQFVTDSGRQLEGWVTYRKAKQLLTVLTYLLDDPWWTRRWIFQEEYCSSERMVLMIPNSTVAMKNEFKLVFGNIPGEILVNASAFRREVTKFCLASSATFFRAGEDRNKCMRVLREAKTYRLLQKYGWMIRDDSLGRAMSTRILGDITRRTAAQPEDSLAIVANCCGYPVRLNISADSTTSKSLSVAIIALFLLNGEILWNDRRKVATGNAFSLLKELSFNEFDPPVDRKKLTFMKQCRLVNVRLTEEGMKTPGHLWRVHEEIRTTDFRSGKYQTADTNKDACLHQLTIELQIHIPSWQTIFTTA